MKAESFEGRLLEELKGYVDERSTRAVGRPEGRRATAARVARATRRAHWRLAGLGVGAAAAITAAAVVANSSSAGSPDLQGGTSSSASGQFYHFYHAQNAGFAIDSEPSGAVEITIVDGSEEPDVDAMRSELAKAGVHAKVLTNVPTCQQLARTPGAPAPIGSGVPIAAPADVLDHPDIQGDKVIYSVDAHPKTPDTTLWIMFSSTLSTITMERILDSGPQPNCL
jgi:hypothetical protein